MSHEYIWNKTKSLLVNENLFFSYEEMVQLFKNNPTEQIVYLDALFQKLSISRMQQLAAMYNKKELSFNYFHTHSIFEGWKQMKIQLNVPMKEYRYADEYIKISLTVLQRNITVFEGERAFELFLLLAEEWDKYNIQNVEEEKEIVSTQIIQEPSGEIIDVKKEEVLVEENIVNKAISDKVIRKQEEKQSQFLQQLRVLQSSSKESVVHADSFGEFRDYMHVVRPIQRELEQLLETITHATTPQLILLCGSVGDGKSHLLSYINENRPELFKDMIIHNDSTESFDPSKDALDTLESVLSPFNDESVVIGQHTIIAINLGVLHNFYHKQRQSKQFVNVCDFIDKTGVFKEGYVSSHCEKQFHMLNFSGYQPYELSATGVHSSFFMDILNKVTKPVNENPFYAAWIADKQAGISSVAHQNYEFLLGSEIKDAIIAILIKSMITQKLIVSTRAFYNFIYDILVPIEPITTLESELDALLPNLLFNHKERSPLLLAIHQQDPLKYRSDIIDQFISKFILSSNRYQTILDKMDITIYEKTWKKLNNKLITTELNGFIKLSVRQYALLNQTEIDELYQYFVNYLFHYYQGNDEELGTLFEVIMDVLYKWKGSPREGYVFVDSPNHMFRTAYPLEVDAAVDETLFGSSEGEECISRFAPSLRIGLEQGEDNYLFELDYELFKLLTHVQKGYRPNRQDVLNGIQFSKFYETIIRNTDKTKSMLVVSVKDGTILEVRKPKFSKSKYEVKQV